MAGPALNQKIEVLQGVDFHETMLFFNPPVSGSKDPVDLVPIDFTGCWARMDVKPSADSTASALLSLAIGSGLEWATGTITPGPTAPGYNNGIAIHVTRAASLAMNSGRPVSAYFDLMIDWPTGETSLVARGTLHLVATASRVTAAAPTITTVGPPDTGSHSGGTTVPIVGTGFVSGCAVTVDGVAAPTVTFTSSTSISFVTPPHAAGGPYTVRVTNPDTQYVEAPLAFQYT